MEQYQTPTHSAKYRSLRDTKWQKIYQAFEACSTFEPCARVSAQEALYIMCPDNANGDHLKNDTNAMVIPTVEPGYSDQDLELGPSKLVSVAADVCYNPVCQHASDKKVGVGLLYMQ